MARRFSPRSEAVYLTDNGRAVCGDHLGSSAKHTGYDISGQEIMLVTPEMALESRADGWTIACEDCGKQALNGLTEAERERAKS
jgi:hypothetical protein